MSYEGITHRLCTHGHYSSVDALNNAPEDKCPYCSGPIMSEFEQDYTNGSDPEYPYTMPPDMTSFLIEEAKGETCNLGHFHETAPARYRVPDNGLWRELLNT